MYQLLAGARQFFLHWPLAMNSGDCAGIKSIQAAFSLIKRISNLDANMRNLVFCLL